MWVPVFLATVVSMFFTIQSMYLKYLSQEHIGFDPSTIAFNCAGIVGAIVLIIGVTWYWQYIETFNKTLFFIGFSQSIFDSLGNASIANSLSKGPAGPVAAIAYTSILLTAFEICRL